MSFAVRKAEASGFRLMKEWIVMMAIVVSVDDMFKSRTEGKV